MNREMTGQNIVIKLMNIFVQLLVAVDTVKSGAGMMIVIQVMNRYGGHKPAVIQADNRVVIHRQRRQRSGICDSSAVTAATVIANYWFIYTPLNTE